MSAAGAPARRPDLATIKLELTDRAEDLARDLMGPPNADTLRQAEWRWGAKGSVGFFVRDGRGKPRGLFADFESDTAGGPLDLVMHARGCSFADACRWAEHWLGYDRPGYVPPPANDAVLAERARQKAEHAREAESEVAKRIEIAQRLWNESLSLTESVGETYFVETRGIPKPPLGWSDNIRFHARSRALIVAATLPSGEVRAVQRVFLTPDGRKIDAEERDRRKLPAIKLTNGAPEGAVVRLPARTLGNRPEAPILLCEGPETGFSVWVSTGHECWIICGGFRGVPLIPGRRHILCRDDDKRHSPADNNLRKLVAGWRRDGHTITVATPWKVRRFDKSDLNDTLRAHGTHAVQARIERALRVESTPIQREPIEIVRRRLDGVIQRFFADAEAWGTTSDGEELPEYAFPTGEDALPGEGGSNAPPPPAHAVAVEVGAGKSRSAYHHAAEMLVRMREAGDKRAIAFAVPTHRLADEHAAIFDAIANAVPADDTGPLGNLRTLLSRRTARVFRGMEAVDPDHPDATDNAVSLVEKVRMCRNLTAVKDAREAGADLFKSVCQRKVGGETISCPFFGVCGYQQQRETSADVWIVPHELIFMRKPSCLGRLAALVVDESCWADGLEGVHGKPMSVPLDALRGPATITQNGNLDGIASDRLHFLRAALLDVLGQHADGPLSREVLQDFNLTAGNATEAYRLEWRRFVDPQLHPQMTPEQRKEAVQAAKGNSQVMRLARVWKGIQALLAHDGPNRSGWLALASEPDDENGSVRRVLHVKGRRDVKTGWRVPTLLLDATMNIDLVRPYWEHVEITAQLLAQAPYQRTRQVLDRSFSKSMLDPINPDDAATDPYLFRLLQADPRAPERRAWNLRRLHAMLCREARTYAPGRVLVVCQKRVKEALPGVGPLPANIELAHHNAVAGRDEWGPQPNNPGVAALIVVGRTMPAVGAVERLAEALTGVAVEDNVGKWFDRGDAIREGLDGKAEAIEAERHPNATAEAIRWQICEGELVQIIGRGRGVNRTAANPLDVLVLTDAPIPVPVAETLNAADLDPTPDDMMAGSGAVVLRNAKHAADAYPELWASHDAAKKAMQRRSGTSLYNYSLFIEECPTPRPPEVRGVRAVYQVAGAGQKPVEAWFDPLLVPDISGWLESRIGRLAWCRVEEPPPPDPIAAPASRSTSSDVEDLPMPLSRVAPRMPEAVEPIALYPVASDLGWQTTRPVVSAISIRGVPPGRSLFVRYPIGFASRARAQQRGAELCARIGYVQPSPLLPVDWGPDGREDMGIPHYQQRDAA